VRHDDGGGNEQDLANEHAGGIQPPHLTPRQAQILELAASGLSDKEIARRLNVAHRTVRTHFEKLFRETGIRNRGQAIAVWSGRPRQAQRARPADECPYPKPFPPGFSECPAYQASQMITLDISHRPLGAVWTCRHLESRLMPNTDYRWYGACMIGDAEARRQWSASVGAARLHDISQLRQEVSAVSGPYIQRLMELKNEADAIVVETTPPDGERRRAIRRQIDGTVDEFMTEMTKLLRARTAILDQLHLPLRACLQLVRIAVDRFIEQGLTEPEWEVPDEVLQLFPPDIQSYFRPRQAITGIEPLADEGTGGQAADSRGAK
jgi:DNA-binding CsgD family transcriptional regulator